MPGIDMTPGSVSTGSAGGGSGSNASTTACAACKFQRRKCTPECPLSPYFPADQPKRFQNVHKLFGFSNTLRILNHVDPSQREDTVKSITYEAETRVKDPVHGCLGVITILQNHVSKLVDELSVAREQLYLLRRHYAQFHHQAEIVGSIGRTTNVVNASSAQQQDASATVLMQQLHNHYNNNNHDIHHHHQEQITNSDFPKPLQSFEPDQYLRSDGGFNDDIKPASTSRFDVARYIRGESPSSGEALVVPKQQQPRPEHYSNEFQSSDNVMELEQSDRYATAIRRRGGSGLLNLTVASDRHPHPDGHELRSAGVYLTLTNN